MKLFYTVICIHFIPLFASGQLEKWTLFFNDIQIDCYKYKIEKETITWAYIDIDTRAIIKEVQSNIPKTTTDATFDSIAEFVRKKYPNERVSLSRTETKKPLIDFTPEALYPNEDFGHVHNHFWIGAVNYYSNLIAANQLSDTAYFKLAEALMKFYGYSSPWGINIRSLSYLDSCLKLNNKYVEAYLLKTKIHLENAIWKGKFASDPNIDVIDPIEVNKASSTIKLLLTFNNSIESLAMLSELNDLKSRYKQYKYE